MNIILVLCSTTHTVIGRKVKGESCQITQNTCIFVLSGKIHLSAYITELFSFVVKSPAWRHKLGEEKLLSVSSFVSPQSNPLHTAHCEPKHNKKMMFICSSAFNTFYLLPNSFDSKCCLGSTGARSTDKVGLFSSQTTTVVGRSLANCEMLVGLVCEDESGRVQCSLECESQCGD